MSDNKSNVTMNNNTIFYEQTEEHIGEPTSFVDEKTSDIESMAASMAALLSKHTGLNKDMLKRIIVNFGLQALLNNPEQIGIDEEQAKTIKNIKNLLYVLGE